MSCAVVTSGLTVAASNCSSGMTHSESRCNRTAGRFHSNTEPGHQTRHWWEISPIFVFILEAAFFFFSICTGEKDDLSSGTKLCDLFLLSKALSSSWNLFMEKLNSHIRHWLLSPSELSQPLELTILLPTIFYLSSVNSKPRSAKIPQTVGHGTVQVCFLYWTPSLPFLKKTIYG